MREIGDGHALVADLTAKLLQIFMWPLEKVFEQAKLVHDFERRRVNGVAAKVTEEVRVLLQHDNLDASTGEKEPEHHSGGASSYDAAALGDRPCRHAPLSNVTLMVRGPFVIGERSAKAPKKGSANANSSLMSQCERDPAPGSRFCCHISGTSPSLFRAR